MATRLKPTRINVDNTPRVWDGATYQDDNKFKWSEWGGDMSYEDFEWVTLTWNSLVIEKISNNVTPTGDFTVTAGTLRPGIEYVLRVNTGNTPYTMTLWTGVTNPNSYKTELKPNTVNQFKFIATSTNQLELEGVDSAVVSEINWGEIDGTLSNQTDLQNALDQKLDKVTSTATNPRAYVVNADWSQATLPITDSATSGTIVRRNWTQITVPATPSADTDAASKKYVDDQVSAATAGAVSDAAYDATTWDGVTWIAPSKNAVRDKIVTMDSAISGNTSNISTINGKIPNEASTSNQLADKAFVGDSINSVTAFYITKNAAGDQFATYAELAAATTFYSWGQVRVPTRNDYTIVLDDENHDHATTRYIYNSVWEYQYTVNETPLTQAQLNALNSGITAGKVATYDWYSTWKQDTLVSWTNIKTINSQSILWNWDISVQPTLVNQSNIKSVNWNNLLGSGDIVLFTSIQLTLTAAWWSNSEQTVTATWVTTSNNVIISPDPASISDYASSMIYGSAQWNNSLTFTCSSDPENDIIVNVLIIN